LYIASEKDNYIKRERLFRCPTIRRRTRHVFQKFRFLEH